MPVSKNEPLINKKTTFFSLPEKPHHFWFIFPVAIFLAGIVFAVALMRAESQPIVVLPSENTTEASCTSGPGSQPRITSLSRSFGPIGTELEVKGCMLSGFEGDLDVYFERADGQKIMLTDTYGSYSKTGDKRIKVMVKEPCQQGETIYGRYSGIPSLCSYIPLTPGLYKVYVEPYGKKSNTVSFTITP